MCIIDGDSSQKDDAENGIYQLPGRQPELEVYENIIGNLDDQLALLTVSCQRSPESQEMVREKVKEISRTNRDPHLLFNQVGIAIGFVSEDIVRGAFLSLWIRSNEDFCNSLASEIEGMLQ